MLVYVLNKEGEPLMPCSPCKARKLLASGKAKVVNREPFTIKLMFGSSGYKQKVTVGCDSGSKVAAFAATVSNKTLYVSEVKLRQDIRSNMDQRRSFRRMRRSRKTRYRKPRFNNRKRDGWLTPTVQSKVNSHKRELAYIKKLIPVHKIIIETASFDIHKITNPEVSSCGYQEGRLKDFYNVKHYVLHRDHHTCQQCKKTKLALHVHHIIFRSNGGSSSPDNLITLCKNCHETLHGSSQAELLSKKLFTKLKSKPTLDATQVATIGSFLKKEVVCEETFGYETKYKRESLGLQKTHYHDAICIAIKQGQPMQIGVPLLKKVHIAQGDYKLCSGDRSEKILPTGKVMGIKKFDKVNSNGVTAFVKGRMSTGYAILMDIEGHKLNIKPIPKLKELKRVAARKSCLTSLVPIENIFLGTTSSWSQNTENHSFAMSP
ncbi:MAG: HNH endonuclease [Chlamydiae bacterium]|nr:HNH endonuclease [Chlamydiota bacterium]